MATRLDAGGANGHARVAYVNARLIDPAAKLDAKGALLT